MNSVPRPRDTDHERACPVCGAVLIVNPDKWDCACPWTCDDCLVELRESVA